MFEVGRICVKIAGRDSGQTCVIVEQIDERYVMVDGQTRRRKCNVSHLEPTKKTVTIKAKASHDDVVKALDGIGVVVAKKGAVRKTKDRLQKQRANKTKPVKVAPKVPKAPKKAKAVEPKVEPKVEVKAEPKVEAKEEPKAEVKPEEKPVADEKKTE
jgi:large subunit ribosomal protein L14e